MSRDYMELERELIEDLEPRTGKDLAGWMAAIDAAALPDRNAIIDWLRPQGFSFSNASWIERIHHNGGKPIYLGQAPPQRRPERRRPKAEPPTVAAAPLPVAAPEMAPKPPPAAEAGDADALKGLLAAGKAYRPLAELVLNVIRRALPGVAIEPRGSLISIERPNQLAALSVTPKELRLGLDLGEAPFVAPLARARIAGAGASITHMIILTDARQVDGGLTRLILEADSRANPAPPEPDKNH